LWIKPTDAPNSNFICITTLHVSGSLSAHHREFLAHIGFGTFYADVMNRLLPGEGAYAPAPGSKRSQLHKMYQSRCTPKTSWLWAQRLPETRRVVIPIKLEFSASVGFIHKEVYRRFRRCCSLHQERQTSVIFHRTTRRHKPQDLNLHRHQCKRLKSYRSVFRIPWFELRRVESRSPPVTIKRSTSLRTSSYTTRESYFRLMVNKQADPQTNGLTNLIWYMIWYIC
jgi:hypothetical protein